ncbi:MAG: type I DNA topoisomerase, partial [Patescibacteria group bacterium]
MDLIIVESPTKAKTLGRFLGSDFQILASMGHVRDLPEKNLGIDIEDDFKPNYVIGNKKQEIVNSLKKAVEKAGKIILATDPDREGEAISWHIAELIKSNKLQRITFHEITETAIKEAFKSSRKIDMNLVNAQQARRILDRLVGYKLSPILWRKVRRGLSAGRVQSVAVRLIVEKEREIKAFIPKEYWEIVAKFLDLEAKLIKEEINNKEEADKIIKDLEGAEYRVAEVITKEVKKFPYPPFTTSTMQQAASNLFGWSAKRTMQVAQNLYEEGLITYHRTDSTNLAMEAVNMVRGFIEKEYGKNYLPAEMKFYKTKSKVVQEAHEAIRPTDVGSISNKDQHKLYELIWKRFVACQMSEAVYEQTSADIAAGQYLFRANGNKQIFDGWQKLYEREEGVELPKLSIGDLLRLLNLVPSQHFTEPPTRFTEATLIKVLEEYGIG